MQKKGVIDFSVNLYCWLSLEILSLSSTFYYFFIQKSSFLSSLSFFLFFFWLRAENVSRTHTRTHKSIYKYIFISPSFPVYVSYTTIFSLYVLKVLDMSGKKVFLLRCVRSLVGHEKFQLQMNVAAGLFGCEGLCFRRIVNEDVFFLFV